MRITKLALLITIFLLMCFSNALVSYAQVGVGVSLSEISVDEPLTPGGIYRLPSVGVINTGKEPGDYEVEVSYSSEQKELKPPAEWVIFEPKSFHLEPGEAQQVAITLQIPVKAKPGDYFAYLEAHPVSKGKGVTIGVAAATKLHFTVKPSNVFVAIWAKVSTFFAITAPASYISLGVLALIGVILLFRRFFRVRFRLERKQ